MPARCGSTLGNSAVPGRAVGHVAGVARDEPEAVVSESSLIAVVDDNASFRDSLRRLLESHGYAVAVFASAAEFLASTRLTAIACLVADVHMPAMTGVELYGHLVATGHAIPTILITAHPDEGVRQRMLGLGLGVGNYLPKPLDETVLIDRLRAAVARAPGARG